MSLQETINQDLMNAMRAGDEVKKRTLRSIKAAITRAEQERKAAAVAKVNKSQYTPEAYEALLLEKTRELPPFADADIVAVLRKEARQREESIDAYVKAARPDLADAERAELVVIQSYLPQQIDEEAIRGVAQTVISEVGATGPKDMGRVMPVVMAKLAGQADGRLVSQVVRQLLGG